jgi:hypothetical protein
MDIECVIVLACDFSERADRGASARLDRALRRLLALGHRPVVVIGPSGDELLAKCPAVEECELAYDADYGLEALSPMAAPSSQARISSIKAGLDVAKGSALAVKWAALEDEIPFFPALEERAATQHEYDVVGFSSDATALTPEPAASAWAITLVGARRLKALPADASWPDFPGIRQALAPRAQAPARGGRPAAS